MSSSVPRLIAVLALLISMPSGLTVAAAEEVVQTGDRNEDGTPDSWIYRNEAGVPLRWIRDSDYDGEPDGWEFFKNGQAYLGQDDTDHDGKVDRISLSLWDDEHDKQRSIMIILQEPEHNLFTEYEDSGWLATDFGE